MEISNEAWMERRPSSSRSLKIISIFDSKKYGIARYVLEEADHFQKCGWRVEKVGLTPDDQSDIFFDLRSIPGLLRWIKYCRQTSDSLVSYHFYENLTFQIAEGSKIIKWICRLLQIYALHLLTHRNEAARIVIHELHFDKRTPFTRKYTTSYVLRQFHRIEVFSTPLVQRIIDHYPGIAPENIAVVNHDRYMNAKVTADRISARQKLGLDKNKTIFLCLGFITPQKGFLEAAEQFVNSAPENSELWVVGECPKEYPTNIEYLADLRKLAESSNQVFVRDEYISDEDFDLWIVSADTVLLPYRGSMNSSVGARAKILGSGIVMKNIPTLVAQLPDARIFNEYSELRTIFMDLASTRSSPQ